MRPNSIFERKWSGVKTNEYKKYIKDHGNKKKPPDETEEIARNSPDEKTGDPPHEGSEKEPLVIRIGFRFRRRTEFE